MTTELEVQVVPVAPFERDVSRIRKALLDHPSVTKELGGARARVLSLVPEPEARKSEEPQPSYRFTAQIYDYDEERVLAVSGDLRDADPRDPRELAVETFVAQPLPTAEEFAAAVAVVGEDSRYGDAIRSRQLTTFRPMPALVEYEDLDGRARRTLGVGLLRVDDDHVQVVAVLMSERRVLHDLDEHLPHGAARCEPTAPDDRCAATGTAGQVDVTVTQGGQTLWQLQVVRPAASSGTNGSGVELRHVRYRGRTVLYRAHVPILNVEYERSTAGGCGPTYRDWQNSEACFQADGQTVAPGFRVCPQPARTILDTGTDAGNFRGVAVYVLGQEVVLVSEMMAGWYRYVSQWRLHSNGTIRPRFGFAGVNNPCTCREHRHHVYWRFDFDVGGAAPNVVEEFNDPPLAVGGSNWHTKSWEIRRPRDPARNRRWRVRNTSAGQAYHLTPGADDGTQDAYGVGDLWALRYRSTELDDGQNFATDPQLTRARLDSLRTPAESLLNTDVVLWYAAHFTHDAAHSHGHVLGPDLTPENW
ncbi:hypothetical protein [Streptomyces luteocolor]|uniref:hypothetical protein n=1 Tax=Streptomyces luteocolor TaxID=285500 RepID=UPI000852E752|nr:hypothetical protein [Streptomyces luteocolor]